MPRRWRRVREKHGLIWSRGARSAYMTRYLLLQWEAMYQYHNSPEADVSGEAAMVAYPTRSALWLAGMAHLSFASL